MFYDNKYSKLSHEEFQWTDLHDVIYPTFAQSVHDNKSS